MEDAAPARPPLGLVTGLGARRGRRCRGRAAALTHGPFRATPGKPPLWLKHGDEVVCEIDGIGRISNRVQAIPARL